MWFDSRSASPGAASRGCPGLSFGPEAARLLSSGKVTNSTESSIDIVVVGDDTDC